MLATLRAAEGKSICGHTRLGGVQACFSNFENALFEERPHRVGILSWIAVEMGKFCSYQVIRRAENVFGERVREPQRLLVCSSHSFHPVG